jgi:hydroxypyruvate isomerase
LTQLKQSVPDWCFFRQQDDPQEYYQRLAALGYQGVEMVPAERWAAARAAGLQLVNVSAPGMQNGLNRRENHAELLPKIRELMRTARENQIQHIIIFSGNRDGQPNEVGLENTVLAAKSLAAEAENAGVILALELLNSYDHVDYQADYPGYIFEFARQVSSPAVKVLYDLYHAQRMGRLQLDELLLNIEYVAHIHIAGSPKRDFPGDQQEINYPTLVSAIHTAGYDAFWGQEFLPGEDRFGELAQARGLFDGFVSG